MEKSTVHDKIENALDQIRPFFHADGGDMRLVEVTDDNVARLELIGACNACSMKEMTLKGGVEEAIKKAVPEIVGVEAIDNTTV